MNEVGLDAFQRAILATHSARAKLAGRARVLETFEGEVVWQGEVLVFDLQGHPGGIRRCYAWEVDGQITAVLEVPPVRSAVDAVRAAILAE